MLIMINMIRANIRHVIKWEVGAAHGKRESAGKA